MAIFPHIAMMLAWIHTETLAIQLWQYNDHPVSSKTEHYQVSFVIPCQFPVHDIFVHIATFIIITDSNTHPHSFVNL